MLEQAGINLKSLNVDKLKSEYEELTKQKSELTATYKNCEKEVYELNRKLENLNQYLGRENSSTPSPEQGEKSKIRLYNDTGQIPHIRYLPCNYSSLSSNLCSILNRSRSISFFNSSSDGI